MASKFLKQLNQTRDKANEFLHGSKFDILKKRIQNIKKMVITASDSMFMLLQFLEIIFNL